jgi:hypothetical protein
VGVASDGIKFILNLIKICTVGLDLKYVDVVVTYNRSKK